MKIAKFKVAYVFTVRVLSIINHRVGKAAIEQDYIGSSSDD
ncbi:MAG: hypothetical protein ACJA0Z_003589 [Halioglobus sp.]|jgi:hypothetical protein